MNTARDTDIDASPGSSGPIRVVVGPVADGNGAQSRPVIVVVVEGGEVVDGATDPTVTVVFRSARRAVQPEAVNMTAINTTTDRGSRFDTTKGYR